MTRAVVGQESVLQHSVVYCNREGWQHGAVYRNTLHCIVAGRAAGGKVVTQYNLEFCDRRQSSMCCEAGSCVPTRRKQASAGLGVWQERAGRARCAQNERCARAWACCWPVGFALGALSLFLTRFDSVLFLSQFLDIVREPGS